jgi:hypothetical protein
MTSAWMYGSEVRGSGRIAACVWVAWMSFVLFTVVCSAQSTDGRGASRATRALTAVRIEITPDATAPAMEAKVGDSLRFRLTARDSTGAVIRDWDRSGRLLRLELRNSWANRDTNVQSWSQDADAYTWALLYNASGRWLNPYGDDAYELPPSKFIDGVATITLVDTKVENGISLAVLSTQEQMYGRSCLINVHPDSLESFLLGITPQIGLADLVFLQRPFEVLVYPRDHYLNILDTTVNVIFEARFPDEIEKSQPSYDEMFRTGTRISRGSHFLVVSNTPRVPGIDTLQWIRCDSRDGLVSGRTAPLEVRPHPPNPFDLVEPESHVQWIFGRAGEMHRFRWTRAIPRDPYEDILVSRFSPDRYSDSIRYTVLFADSASRTKRVRVPSDSAGKAEQLTVTNARLEEYMYVLEGWQPVRWENFCWWVEASDGASIRLSRPPDHDIFMQPGYYFFFEPPSGDDIPSSPVSAFSLSQSYPNPVMNSSGAVAIDFSLAESSYAVLSVRDMLGIEVARPVDALLPPGPHTASLAVGRLAPGVYTYQLIAQSWRASRTLIILR